MAVLSKQYADSSTQGTNGPRDILGDGHFIFEEE